MAKRKSNRPAKTANLDLWAFYQLGLKVKKLDGHIEKQRGSQSTSGMVQDFCEDEEISRSTAEKARLFVSCYTTKELQWMCNLGVTSGEPLMPCHLHRLVTLPKAERRKFTELTAKHGWSVRQLTAEITKGRPKRSSGGMRPVRPQTVEDALPAIERLSSQWLRYAGMLEDDESEDGVSVKDLSPAMQKSFSKASAEMANLHDKVEQQIKRKTRAHQKKR
jgi:hypothetical protein